MRCVIRPRRRPEIGLSLRPDQRTPSIGRRAPCAYPGRADTQTDPDGARDHGEQAQFGTRLNGKHAPTARPAPGCSFHGLGLPTLPGCPRVGPLIPAMPVSDGAGVNSKARGANAGERLGRKWGTGSTAIITLIARPIRTVRFGSRRLRQCRWGRACWTELMAETGQGRPNTIPYRKHNERGAAWRKERRRPTRRRCTPQGLACRSGCQWQYHRVDPEYRT